MPASVSNSDGKHINYDLRTLFYSDVAGEVTAIRFCKSPKETGKHTGRIFSASGTQLASVQFASETASGWQQQTLAQHFRVNQSDAGAHPESDRNAFRSISRCLDHGRSCGREPARDDFEYDLCSRGLQWLEFHQHGRYYVKQCDAAKLSRHRVAGDYFEIAVSGNVSNFVIENCEINGAGLNGQEGVYGVYIEDDCQVTINGVNIHNLGSPITISDGRIVVENSYFHDFFSGPGTHYNGIQYNGGGSSDFSLSVQHNSIINNQDQTDAIMIDNDFGSVNNVTINNNYLSGGSYTVYCDGRFNNSSLTNVSFTNNVMGIGGYGYDAIESCNAIFTGNVDAVTGQPLPE